MWQSESVPSSSVQTLLYLLQESPAGRLVLLGRKRRGVGLGKVIAPGGHVEPGETVLAAAVREAEEEVGVQVAETDASLVAVLRYRFPSRPALDAEVHAFVAQMWSGAVLASEELEPRWYLAASLPLDLMWDDERYWLPQVLDGARLTAQIVYDESCEKVVKFDSKSAQAVVPHASGNPCAYARRVDPLTIGVPVNPKD